MYTRRHPEIDSALRTKSANVIPTSWAVRVTAFLADGSGGVVVDRKTVIVGATARPG